MTSGVDKSIRTFRLSFREATGRPYGPGHVGGHGAAAVESARPYRQRRCDGPRLGLECRKSNRLRSPTAGRSRRLPFRPTDCVMPSASANNTAKLWNAANNQQIAEMKGDLRYISRSSSVLTADDAQAKAAVTLAMNAIPATLRKSGDRTDGSTEKGNRRQGGRRESRRRDGRESQGCEGGLHDRQSGRRCQERRRGPGQSGCRRDEGRRPMPPLPPRRPTTKKCRRPRRSNKPGQGDQRSQ